MTEQEIQELMAFSKSLLDRATLMAEKADVLNKLDDSPSFLSSEFDALNIILTGLTMLSTQGMLSPNHSLRIFEVVMNVQAEILEARLAEITSLKKDKVV